jgi:hypothetical protein
LVFLVVSFLQAFLPITYTHYKLIILSSDIIISESLTESSKETLVNIEIK